MATPRRWIRVDVTWSSSEWVIGLSPGGRLAFIELLAYAKAHGIAGRAKALSPKVAARRWDIPEIDIQAMLNAARSDGALEAVDGDWVITGWKTYQEVDPTAASRQRKHRAERSRLSPLRDDTRDSRDIPLRKGVTRRATETLTLTVTETGTERQEQSRATELPTSVATPPASQPVQFLEGHPQVVELLGAVKHPGGIRSTSATIAHRFLYNDDGTLADPSVKGLELDERVRLVTAALLEYATQPEPFDVRFFAGFVKRLRGVRELELPASRYTPVAERPPEPPPATPEDRDRGKKLVREATNGIGVGVLAKALGPQVPEIVDDPDVIAKREAERKRQREAVRGPGAAS